MRFSFAGIPVRIHASFLLIAFFGWSAGFDALETTLWTFTVLVAVFVHELGHALTARRFGSTVSITLYGLGGLTHWRPRAPLPAIRRLLIFAAGSGAGFVLGLLVWWLGRSGALGTDLAFTLDQAFPSQIAAARFTGNPGAFVAAVTVWVSLLWGLINWLPLRSLDGGHMLRTLMEMIVPRRADTIASFVSAATGIVAAILAWREEWYLAAFFALYLGFAGITFRPAAQRPIPTQELPEEQFPI
jgi:membrane-associated protease RseP (regulator of RpoE activity)